MFFEKLLFHLDPVLYQIGPLSIHWYGVLHVVGFIGAWFYYEYVHQSRQHLTRPERLDLFFYLAVGVIVGGRWGYLGLYEPCKHWFQEPGQFLQLWAPGRSFHGGLMGAILALWLLAKHTKRSFWALADYTAPAVPIGIGFGRLGNLINGELWGRVTDKPWGIVFPQADSMLRHPSPLYECFLEGFVLFLIVHFYSRFKQPVGSVAGVFLVGYGILRMIAECFREPDWHQGFVLGGSLTMGQVLSIPMIGIGLVILIVAFSRKPKI